MDELTTVSTSKYTAVANEIVLRETTTTRLVFVPLLVANPNNDEASVKGDFVFQKKGRIGLWQDAKTISLSSLKSGEGYKLSLNTRELLKFHDETAKLYQLYRDEGIPKGENKYIKASPELAKLSELTSDDVALLLNGNSALGMVLLAKLLNWAINLEDPVPFLEKLVELNPESLRKLNSSIALQNLHEVLDVWNANSGNANEEFWQQQLLTHSFVIEQLFAWPVSILKGKAYVGGKSFENDGGKIVDFLLRNRLTNNSGLVEIKTPPTKLLSGVYRDLPNISSQLSGTVVQLLNYKQVFQNEFLALRNNFDGEIETFDPRCLAIIGCTDELDTADKKRAFELFRLQLRGITILTFDEVFERVNNLVRVLESNRSPVATKPATDDEIPF